MREIKEWCSQHGCPRFVRRPSRSGRGLRAGGNREDKDGQAARRHVRAQLVNAGGQVAGQSAHSWRVGDYAGLAPHSDDASASGLAVEQGIVLGCGHPPPAGSGQAAISPGRPMASARRWPRRPDQEASPHPERRPGPGALDRFGRRRPRRNTSPQFPGRAAAVRPVQIAGRETFPVAQCASIVAGLQVWGSAKTHRAPMIFIAQIADRQPALARCARPRGPRRPAPTLFGQGGLRTHAETEFVWRGPSSSGRANADWQRPPGYEPCLFGRATPLCAARRRYSAAHPRPVPGPESGHRWGVLRRVYDYSIVVSAPRAQAGFRRAGRLRLARLRATGTRNVHCGEL